MVLRIKFNVLWYNNFVFCLFGDPIMLISTLVGFMASTLEISLEIGSQVGLHGWRTGTCMVQNIAKGPADNIKLKTATV